jgi:predicted RNA-binding protein with RPS1 domain
MQSVTATAAAPVKPTIRSRPDATVPGLAISNTREYAKQQLASILSKTENSEGTHTNIPADHESASCADGGRHTEPKSPKKLDPLSSTNSHRRARLDKGAPNANGRQGQGANIHHSRAEHDKHSDHNGSRSHHESTETYVHREKDGDRELERVYDRKRDRERDRGGHGRERHQNRDRDRDHGRHETDYRMRGTEAVHERFHRHGADRGEHVNDHERVAGVRADVQHSKVHPARDDMRNHDCHRQEQLDGAAEVFKVYRGRVSNTTKFGAFVELLGVKGRVEGMVHISNMASRRLNDVSAVCKRGDQVWVKVLGIKEPKPGHTRPQIELSMRDVDQSTGNDLLPLHDTEHQSFGMLLLLKNGCTLRPSRALPHVFAALSVIDFVVQCNKL